MSRKKRDFTRPVLPDPKFHDQVVAKTINIIMKHGKKSTAERALYSAFDIVAKQNTGEPIDMFKKALAAIRPVVEVRSRRVGGATYQVPTEVRGIRAESLSIRWLILGANSRGEKTLAERLAGEMIDALQNRGSAIKKREDTHRMAEANKAFAHFRW